MMVITRKQREALKRVYDRGPIYKSDIDARKLITDAGWTFIFGDRDALWYHPHLRDRRSYRDHHQVIADFFSEIKPLTYRQFRKTVQNGFDCLMVRWNGMWLGIETDGYTHS